jgi:hypothetical protein
MSCKKYEFFCFFIFIYFLHWVMSLTNYENGVAIAKRSRTTGYMSESQLQGICTLPRSWFLTQFFVLIFSSFNHCLFNDNVNSSSYTERNLKFWHKYKGHLPFLSCLSCPASLRGRSERRKGNAASEISVWKGLWLGPICI